MGEKYYNGY